MILLEPRVSLRSKSPFAHRNPRSQQWALVFSHKRRGRSVTLRYLPIRPWLSGARSISIHTPKQELKRRKRVASVNLSRPPWQRKPPTSCRASFVRTGRRSYLIQILLRRLPRRFANLIRPTPSRSIPSLPPRCRSEAPTEP